MKTFAASALTLGLLGNVAVAQKLPSSVTLHPVGAAPFTLEFTKANYYYVKTNTTPTADSDAKIETVDLKPNAAAFKRCHFGSTGRADLVLETAEDGGERYRIKPPTKVVSIDCSSGCVPRGGKCFDPSSDASFVCCEGYCSGSVCV